MSIRSDILEDVQTPLRVEKIKKEKENLIISEFYGFVSLIVQLKHYKLSVTTVVIPHLQHI
jgi:hypothetical protein